MLCNFCDILRLFCYVMLHILKYFNNLFSGRLITNLGGHGSGFKSLNQKDSYDTDGVRLYKVYVSKIP